MLRPFGLILAGGRSSRMGGGDKTLLTLGNRTLAALIVARVRPQCVDVALNANGDASRFASLGHPIIADMSDGIAGQPAGPLAGVLAGLAHLHRTHAAEWLLTVPGDTPFVPPDLARRLAAALETGSSRSAYARSGGRSHPLAALWHVSALQLLRHAVEERALRRVTAFHAEMQGIAVDWPTDPFDPFFNINTPDDLAVARDLLDQSVRDPSAEA